MVEVGQLFWATGLDNSGLQSGARAAGAILDRLGARATGVGSLLSARNLGLLGITAGLVAAGNAAIDFADEFDQAFREVATISATARENFNEMKDDILALTTTIPVGAVESTRALYQIVSAGQDGADAFQVLEVAARAAIGGVTETAIAADGLTSILNAYNLTADDAERVSDIFFTTVRLGKTTFDELASSIAQVTPIASQFGISFEEIGAAIATLTAGGVDTATAVVQLRGAILRVNEVLGDGAFQTRTLNEAFQEVVQSAGGSQQALRELIPDVRGFLGVLGLTGANTERANEAFRQFQNVAGEAGRAYELLAQSSVNQSKILANNITAAFAGVGNTLSQFFTDITRDLNEAFQTGQIDEFFDGLARAVQVAIPLMIAFNASTVATTTSLAAQEVALQLLIARETILNKIRVLSTTAQAAYNTAVAGGASASRALIVAIRALTGALATNPFTAIVAVLGVATAAFFALRTEVLSTEEALDRVGKALDNITRTRQDIALIDEYSKLSQETNRTAKEQERYNELIAQLATLYPETVAGVDEYGKIIALNGKQVEEANNRIIESNRTLLQASVTTVQNSIQDLRRQLIEQRFLAAGGTDLFPVAAEDIVEAAGEVQRLTGEIGELEEQLVTLQSQFEQLDFARLAPEDLVITERFPELATVIDESLSDADLAALRKRVQSIFDVNIDDAEIVDEAGAVLALIDQELGRRNPPEVAVNTRLNITQLEKQIQDLNDKLEATTDPDEIVSIAAEIVLREDQREELRKDLDRALIAQRISITPQLDIEGTTRGINDLVIAQAPYTESLEEQGAIIEENAKTIGTDTVKAIFNSKTNQDALTRSLDRGAKRARTLADQIAKEDARELLNNTMGVADAIGEAAILLRGVNDEAAELLGTFANIVSEAAQLGANIAAGNIPGAVASSIKIIGNLISTIKDSETSLADFLNAFSEGTQQIIRNFDLVNESLSSVGAQTFDGLLRAINTIISRFDTAEDQIDRLEEKYENFFFGPRSTTQRVGTTRATSGRRPRGGGAQDLDLDLEDDIEDFDSLSESIRNAAEEFQRINNLIVRYSQLLARGGLRPEDEEAIRDTLEQLLELRQRVVETYETIAGVTVEDLASSITEAFLRGETSVEQFATRAEDLIRQSLINAFRTQFISKQLEALVASLATDVASDETLTNAEIQNFIDGYTAIAQSAGEIFNRLQEAADAAGIDLREDISGVGDGLAGAVRTSITEDTANLLVGLWNRTSLDIRDQLVVQQGLSETLTEIAEYTLRTATAVEEINDKITASNLTGRDSGIAI